MTGEKQPVVPESSEPLKISEQTEGIPGISTPANTPPREESTK